VSFVLLTWVENTEDFEDNKHLCAKLIKFIQSTENPNSYLLRAQKALDNVIRTAKPLRNYDVPTRKSLNLTRLLDATTNKIAEQLTLLEFDILVAVNPKEFLKQVRKF
jgi:hypothetical protein